MSGFLKLRITHSDNTMAQTIVQDMTMFTLYTYHITFLCEQHTVNYKVNRKSHSYQLFLLSLVGNFVTLPTDNSLVGVGAISAEM